MRAQGSTLGKSIVVLGLNFNLWRHGPKQWAPLWRSLPSLLVNSERRKPGSFVRVDTGEGPESPVLLNVAAHLLGTGHPSQCDGNTGS